MNDPSQMSLILSTVIFFIVAFSFLLTVLLCGGKKEAQPMGFEDQSKVAAGGATEAGAEGGGEEGGGKSKKSAKEKSQKSGKQPVETVPKGEYGTLRNIDNKMAASKIAGGKDAAAGGNYEELAGKVGSQAYRTMGAAGKLSPTVAGKGPAGKVGSQAYGTLAAAPEKALSPTMAPKKGGKVSADAYGTLQIADQNALQASKRGKFAPKGKEEAYGTLFGVGDKMSASKR